MWSHGECGDGEINSILERHSLFSRRCRIRSHEHVGVGAEGQAFLSKQSSNSLVFEEDGNGEAFVYLLVKRHRWQTDAECKNINEAIPITFRDVGWLVSR